MEKKNKNGWVPETNTEKILMFLGLALIIGGVFVDGVLSTILLITGVAITFLGKPIGKIFEKR